MKFADPSTPGYVDLSVPDNIAAFKTKYGASPVLDGFFVIFFIFLFYSFSFLNDDFNLIYNFS